MTRYVLRMSRVSATKMLSFNAKLLKKDCFNECPSSAHGSGGIQGGPDELRKTRQLAPYVPVTCEHQLPTIVGFLDGGIPASIFMCDVAQ